MTSRLSDMTHSGTSALVQAAAALPGREEQLGRVKAFLDMSLQANCNATSNLV
jgi:hypothetical protein